jgi:serine/threonine protein kinase
MPPGPGVAIGAYELLELLGKGGMGEVYRARDTRLGRFVAVKVLSSDLRHNATAAARLDREAKLASSLNHPGIVTVFDVGRFEDRPFLVMELVEGEPLSTLLARRKLRLAEAVDIACQTADALAAAHEAGMVHRDLKLAVEGQDSARFGIVAITSSLPTRPRGKGRCPPGGRSLMLTARVPLLRHEHGGSASWSQRARPVRSPCCGTATSSSTRTTR